MPVGAPPVEFPVTVAESESLVPDPSVLSPVAVVAVVVADFVPPTHSVALTDPVVLSFDPL